jgi:hypothetical protein
MTAVFVIAIIVRGYFFIGYGRGDDSIYAMVVNNILTGGFKSLDLNYIMNYRLGLYLPIVLFFSIFGINDFSFALFPILASLGSIIVIYFIGKELFGKETGIIAAILMIFCPFDAVFCSTMVIDVITSFFTALCFLLFLKGHNEKSWKYILYFSFASMALFYNYMIKMPSVLIMFSFGCITLINIRSFRRHLVFYGSFSILLFATFLVDYYLIGDFLNRFHILRDQSAKAMGPYKSILLEYIWWMFYRMPDGSILFGYMFHALLPALLFVLILRFRRSYTVIIWALSMFLLHEFLPTQFHLPYQPGPRFPRYIHAFILPSVLIMAVALYSLWEWKKYLFAVCISGIIISCMVETYILYKTWAEPFSDTNEASKFMASHKPEKPVIADGWFFNRFAFDTKFRKSRLAVWGIGGKSLQMEIIQKKDYTELEKVKNVYVVVGGSRAVYASMHSVFNFGDYKPPEHWKLIKEIPKEITLYRYETLKIFDVGEK